MMIEPHSSCGHEETGDATTTSGLQAGQPQSPVRYDATTTNIVLPCGRLLVAELLGRRQDPRFRLSRVDMHSGSLPSCYDIALSLPSTAWRLRYSSCCAREDRTTSSWLEETSLRMKGAWTFSSSAPSADTAVTGRISAVFLKVLLADKRPCTHFLTPLVTPATIDDAV